MVGRAAVEVTLVIAAALADTDAAEFCQHSVGTVGHAVAIVITFAVRIAEDQTKPGVGTTNAAVDDAVLGRVVRAGVAAVWPYRRHRCRLHRSGESGGRTRTEFHHATGQMEHTVDAGVRTVVGLAADTSGAFSALAVLLGNQLDPISMMPPGTFGAWAVEWWQRRSSPLQ